MCSYMKDEKLREREREREQKVKEKNDKAQQKMKSHKWLFRQTKEEEEMIEEKKIWGRKDKSCKIYC